MNKLQDLIYSRSITQRKIYEIDKIIWELLKYSRKTIIKDTKEYQVLKMRLYEHKNLEEIGKVFGVTRERIRQIEAKALERFYEPDTNQT